MRAGQLNGRHSYFQPNATRVPPDAQTPDYLTNRVDNLAGDGTLDVLKRMLRITRSQGATIIIQGRAGLSSCEAPD